MKQGTTGQARVHVNAPPEKVYDLVSDVTRMGEWSPETVKCEWIDGASGPAVGARFKGTNKRKFARWSTKPTVVAASAPHEFAFATKETRWTYRFEPAGGGGTELSESFEMIEDVPLFVVLGERLMGIKDRKADLERGMQQTIDRIKRVAEGSA
ncbi:MAG: SRPBCC family protein [Acidimicrobiia bacterium]|nr:SRPBCC family protein [Acidimicrobiia bacterium]